MSGTVTFRLDPETARILRDLTRRTRGTKTQVIKEALRARWKSANGREKPTSWEIYKELYPRLKAPRKGEPLHDRARHANVIHPTRRKYALAELVSKITTKNRHRETSWGPAVGEELW